MYENFNINFFVENNDLLKEFTVPGNFGALWCTIWQLCCKYNSNDLGYICS